MGILCPEEAFGIIPLYTILSFDSVRFLTTLRHRNIEEGLKPNKDYFSVVLLLQAYKS